MTSDASMGTPAFMTSDASMGPRPSPVPPGFVRQEGPRPRRREACCRWSRAGTLTKVAAAAQHLASALAELALDEARFARLALGSSIPESSRACAAFAPSVPAGAFICCARRLWTTRSRAFQRPMWPPSSSIFPRSGRRIGALRAGSRARPCSAAQPFLERSSTRPC